ncbi:MAG: DUF2339 domain-containing protein [Gammaproteobacteria bacterium]|nr:DUF2339 domain-containing protein [Gammaproteobacteria bacterium]
MEFLFVILLGLSITLLIGSILGIVAFFKINTLTAEISKLKLKLAQLISQLPTNNLDKPVSEQPDKVESQQTKAPFEQQAESSIAESTSSIQEDEERHPVSNKYSHLNVTATTQGINETSTVEAKEKFNNQRLENAASTPEFSPQPSVFITSLKENWMAWLGGFCIALAGIFFGKYSIEQGLLGPGMRIFLGCATGLALHAVAIWLLRKKGGHIALAAMAGGGSITLFATLLSALHFYQMFSPLMVFVLLALVALATMWLAILHGPALAIIGMLGAYTVPIMVSTGSGNLIGAMIYALIITVSVLLLVRAVKINWLWWGALIGGLFWWLISMTSEQPDGFRGIYLGVLAYLILSVISGNYRLNKVFPYNGVWPFNKKAESSSVSQQESFIPLSLTMILIAQLSSILLVGWFENWASFLILPLIILYASRYQPHLASIVWGNFIGTIICILLPLLFNPTINLPVDKSSLVSIPELLSSLLSLGLIHLVFGVLNYRGSDNKSWNSALIALAPSLLMLTTFLLSDKLMSQLSWSLLFVIMGALSIFIALHFIRRNSDRWVSIWHLLSGNLSYSVAVYIVFENTTLTLALSAQVFTIAWIIKRFNVAEISWLLKTVVSIVVVRLTLNPWIVDYPPTGHWPLWTYGGATLICFLSSLQLKDFQKLKLWTQVASLHLFVLTFWTETRYVLHDGDVFKAVYSFNDMVLNGLLFGALSLVYFFKSKVSETVKKWYLGYSYVLLILSGLNYLFIISGLMKSEKWIVSAIGTQPIFNILIFALGIPIVLAYLISKYYDQRLKSLANIVMGILSFIFISFEIRHLWQQTVSLKTPTSDGELYTYSVVWLLSAVAIMFYSGWKQSIHVYRSGLIVLSVVIFKIFLIDLAGLDGLLRIASFMGLGLALVGISLLHQKIKPQIESKEV